MRRRAEFEGVDHAAEIRIDIGLRIARDFERLVHDVGTMVADRARRQFDAVTDDVILPRQDVERVFGFERFELALRHREGVVAEVDLAGVFVGLEHREVDDPAHFEFARVDEFELFGDAGACETGELCRLRFLARSEKQAIVGADAKLGGERVHLFRTMVLGDRAAPLAALARCVAEARETFALRPAVHIVEEFAALFGSVRRRDSAHDVAGGNDVGKAAEARPGEMRRHVGDDQRVAQVRLVIAIFQHRLAIRDARERTRRGYRLAVGKFLEHAREDGLDGIEHVILRDEAHFEVELIEFARATVGARVFVAEAGRDLEIAVEARDHQQLFEHLRRLRQRIEFAGMDAAGHQIVARALGRRGGQDRGLEFGEALIGHAAAQAGNHVRTQHDVGVQAFAAQIEEAVFQADVLRIILFACDRHRQFDRRRLDRDVARAHFNRARRQVRVDRFGRARDDVAGDRHHAFGTQAVEDRERRIAAVGDDLGKPIMVAQIDEQQPAMVALAMHPSRDADRLADLFGAKLAAIMGAIGVHGIVFQCSGARVENAPIWPRLRQRGERFVKGCGCQHVSPNPSSTSLPNRARCAGSGSSRSRAARQRRKSSP